MANDIIDVSVLMQGVQTGRRNLSETDPQNMLEIKHQQNKHVVSTGIADSEMLAQESAVTQALFSQQQKFIEGRGQLALDAAQFQANVANNLADETSRLVENREMLERSYQDGLEQMASQVEGANYSFWRNPLTYIRDQYRLNNTITKLNHINGVLQATYNAIDQEYAQAAQELQHYRQTSMTTGLAVLEVENMVQTNMLNSKLSLVNDYRKQLDTLVGASAARQTVSEAWAKGEQDRESQLGLARYLHKIQTGSNAGFNEVIADRYLHFYNNLDPDAKNSFVKGYLRAAEFDSAGVDWTIAEHFEDLARNNDGESLAQIGWLNRDQGLMALVDLGMQKSIRDTEQQLTQQWLADPNNMEAYTQNGGIIPTAVQNNISRQARESVQRRPGLDMLVTSGQMVEEDMQTFLGGRKDSLPMYSGAAELVELSGHSPNAIRYFQSEAFRNLTTTGAEGPFDTLSNFTLELSKQLVEAGVSSGEVPSVIADYYAQTGLAMYRAQGEHGLQLESLMRLGQNLRPSIRVNPLPVNGFVARLSNFVDGPNAQYIRRADFNFTDPSDIQNFLARAEVAQGELGRSNALVGAASAVSTEAPRSAAGVLPGFGSAYTGLRTGRTLAEDIIRDTAEIPRRIQETSRQDSGGIVSDAQRRRQQARQNLPEE